MSQIFIAPFSFNILDFWPTKLTTWCSSSWWWWWCPSPPLSPLLKCPDADTELLAICVIFFLSDLPNACAIVANRSPLPLPERLLRVAASLLRSSSWRLSSSVRSSKEMRCRGACTAFVWTVAARQPEISRRMSWKKIHALIAFDFWALFSRKQYEHILCKFIVENFKISNLSLYRKHLWCQI